jgi:phenol 2-monooxygenase
LFANRVIRASGAYLRFIGNMKQPLAQLRGLGDDLEVHKEDLPILDGTTEADQSFMRSFFARNAHFLLGVESPIVESAICPTSPSSTDESPVFKPTSLCNGIRIPNPRVCFSLSETGYLYDKMTGVARFHILLFASDLLGPVQTHLVEFAKAAFGVGGFYVKYGSADRFNVVLVTKAMPDVANALLESNPELEILTKVATVVHDDRAPDEDAHYWFGVNHARGCVVVGRPDLRVGVSAALDEGAGVVDRYLGGFLIRKGERVGTP